MTTKKISIKVVGPLLLVVIAILANHIAVRSERNPICDTADYEGKLPSYCLPPQLEVNLLPSSARVSDREDFSKADGYTIFVDIAILSLGYLAIRQTKKWNIIKEQSIFEAVTVYKKERDSKKLKILKGPLVNIMK